MTRESVSKSMELPVRQNGVYGSLNVAEFIIAVEAYNSNIDVGLIKRAFIFAERAHQGQKRISGEPYTVHSKNVALIIAEQHLDSVTIASGLLHDVVEDTSVTLDALRKEFGDEIAGLVDGVTRIST